MVTFFDGPAKGEKLHLRRTPVYLRVVINKLGRVDALDDPSDTPTETETMYAYRLIDGTEYSGIMCGTKHGCVTFRSAMYKLLPMQPSQEIMRCRDSWYEWTEKREKILNKE